MGVTDASSRDTRFAALGRVVAAPVAAAMAELVEHGSDGELSRINVLDFASRCGLPDERVIDGFVHASKLGLFDLSWSLLCPGCGGVLDARTSVRDVADNYHCALCCAAYRPTLDEMVEVSFTVNPSVRRIAAHDPDSLDPVEYFRLLYWSQGLILPEGDDWRQFIDEVALELEPIPPREKLVVALNLPAELVIVFDPITHGASFLDVKGEPVRERRDLGIVFDSSGSAPDKLEVAPGPVRLTLRNATDRRILPGVFVAADRFHHMFQRKRRFFTAKHLLTNQTFRDLYRTDTLAVDQRLAIASLTVLFTDLKGSTELYERVGDLLAYDLVRAHFKVLGEVVRDQGGAVVKTIGDAIMATFPTPERGVAAALSMRDAMQRLNRERGSDDLLVKIGMHVGPCLAVMLNERLDYFGQTVNIASRVQGLATEPQILATEPIVAAAAVQELVARQHLAVVARRASLRGIRDEMTVFDIR